jgi:gluconolactonase
LPELPGSGRATLLSAAGPTPAFESLEGPFWVGKGGYLLFSDVVEANGPAARIYRFDPASRQYSVVPYPATGPTSTNGLAVDGSGALLACERYNARVVRVDEPTHNLTVLAGAGAAPRLNAPNDLAVRGDGNIYFTDSDWGVKAGGAHAPMGVYRIDPAGRLSRILDIEKPNGVALSPDGAFLYVGSDTQANVWRLPLDAQGMPGVSTLFIDGATVPGGFKVPDGICIDDGGDLYVTNNDDGMRAIIVFDPAGHAKARLPIPERPSNCTFGGADRKTLYVTTLHAIYQVRVPTAGLP